MVGGNGQHVNRSGIDVYIDLYVDAPHFWALALFMRNDYDDAEVPMLTVTHGRRATRNHILGYTVLLAVLAIATGFTSIGGVFYLTVAIVLNAQFLWGAIKIWRRDEDASEAIILRLNANSLNFHYCIYSRISVRSCLRLD